MSEEARRAVEHAARQSYGRLLAYLAARCHDLMVAEDALADAFQAALRTWPADGVPAVPEAWLLTAARRKLIDGARGARVQAEALPLLHAEALPLLARAEQALAARAGLPDERLALLFVCAHPQLDPAVHTPLMLQAVLGLDAARIASAFLVKPATMGQRLVRAKARIRDARLPFEVPEAHELAPRLGAVLSAIYAAYGEGHTALSREAIELGALLAGAMPEEPEVLGLLALMLHREARASSGAFVPLDRQDPARWSEPLISRAEQLLERAARARAPGRFQLEAAIHSAHASRRWGGETPHEAIALLYEGLARLAPTTGVLVARAAAVAEARGPEQGWALLSELPAAAVKDYQPYWAVAAHVLARLGQEEPAANAYRRAIGLSRDAAARAYLQARLEALEPGS